MLKFCDTLHVLLLGSLLYKKENNVKIIYSKLKHEWKIIFYFKSKLTSQILFDGTLIRNRRTYEGPKKLDYNSSNYLFSTFLA